MPYKFKATIILKNGQSMTIGFLSKKDFKSEILKSDAKSSIRKAELIDLKTNEVIERYEA